MADIIKGGIIHCTLMQQAVRDALVVAVARHNAKLRYQYRAFEENKCH